MNFHGQELFATLPSYRIQIGLVILALCVPPSLAADGEVEINHAAILQGGISSTDAPGYPATVSESGSYRLTGNLTVSSNQTAIEVEAAHVTIDLAGFAISGPNDCSSFPCTIVSSGVGVKILARDVTVMNGLISGMGNSGILSTQPLTRLESVRSIGNGIHGAQISSTSQVTRSLFVGNGGQGLQLLGEDTIFMENTMSGNFGAAVTGGVPVSGNHCDDGSCSHFVLRRVLISSTQNTGGEAPEQCPDGFHMASLFEVLDPTSFKWVGSQFSDAGGGPPSGFPAWIRTGINGAGIPITPGQANCELWDSNSSEKFGSVASLVWDTDVTGDAFPWKLDIFSCDTVRPTWCAED